VSTIRWVDASGVLHSEAFVATSADWPFALVLSAESVMTIGRGSRDAGHREFLTRRGVRDAILAPLHIDGTASGVLFVEDRRGDVATFTDDDAKLFETVATHVSSVLDNSRLLDRLRHESRHDTLTGLTNRHYFRQQLTAELDKPDATFALLLADLDRFKEINDTLGHHHGDLLIMEVADRITAAAPAGSTVARLGGDEFAMIVPVASAVDAMAAAQMLQDAIAAPCVLDGLAIDVAASFGIALTPQHGQEENVLLKRADMAMYAAKSSGTAIEVYDADRDDYSPRRLALATELRAAIERGELHLHYQPQANVDGLVTGVEALVRWRHPQFGAVGPDEFIPLAEHSGAIVPLTRWVMGHALSQLAAWHAQGLPLTMSINVSMRNLLDAGIVDTVADELKRAGVAPQMVTLEITESHIMSDPGRTLPILHRLARLGVRLSIDDFGTGYSSLSYLRQFPVHEIKIDKSFVGHTDAQDNRVIVKAIVGIAQSLGVQTVAEGVEDEKTKAWVSAIGCTRYQGWVLARPMSSEELVAWMAQHRADASDEVVVLRPSSTPPVDDLLEDLPEQRSETAAVAGARPRGRVRRGR
jgi:diguanylate cyclase (GGDEF)-like protein